MRWDSFIYYFVVGGLIFFISLLLSWRGGDHSWKRREDRRCVIYLLAGFAFYLLLYLLWQLYAMGTI